MKKQISLVLAFLLLSLSFASCGSSGEQTGETSSVSPANTSEAETTRDYPDVEGLDFGGADFNVLQFNAGPDAGYSEGFYFALDEESETGDVLKDSLYRRNRRVEELLKLKLHFIGDDNAADLLASARSAVMAGDGSYDLIVPYLRHYPNFINEGLVMKLSGMGSLDFSKPWWDERSVSELTILNGLYGVVSDFTIADKMSSMCVFFSKQLVEDFKLEDPYRLVLDGKWTFDYMLEKARLVESDLNGNSERDLEDRYGILCDADFSYEILHAGGWKIAEKGADGIPVLTVYEEPAVSALQKIYSVMNEPMFLNRKDNNLTMPQMAQIFASGQVLYFQHIPEALLELRQSVRDFGIIPVPKYDAAQENYITPLTHWAAVFSAIPMSAPGPERSAAVLEVLAGGSHYEVMPELYNDVLDVEYTRDDESAQMLDLIFDNRTYDIGNICGFGGLADVVLNLWKTPDIASTLASKQSAAENDLNKLIETIRSLD